MPHSTSQPAIAVAGLRKSYGEKEAVAGVDVTVAPGEVFCLLGPNGAGKTTTTEILEGYRLASHGTVSVLGHDPARRERKLRERIGIVPQSGGLQTNLSVAELLEMFSRPYPKPRPVDEVIELVELTEQCDQDAADLSGGQRRRLDLGLALIGDPDLIFLDEPTTGFDPHARRQAWDTIRSLCDLGKTVWLTTHFMDEAQALADTVAVMREGKIVASGPPSELGGRGTRPAEVAFRIPPELTTAGAHGLADLPPLPTSATVELVRGETVRITTADPLRTTHAITGWALERGLALHGFSVEQPTLEDVYLELTSA